MIFSIYFSRGDVFALLHAEARSWSYGEKAAFAYQLLLTPGADAATRSRLPFLSPPRLISRVSRACRDAISTI